MKNALHLDIVSKYRQEIYGFSILWIMIFHGYLCKVYYFQDNPVLNFFRDFLFYGYLGVEIFLFLSGICLYFSFSKNQNLENYMSKRLKRLYSPVFLICGVYWIWCVKMNYITWKATLLNLSGISFWFTGKQQIWFISCILVCYLLYPYLYYFIFKKEKQFILRTILLAVSIIVFIFLLNKGVTDYYNLIEIALNRFPSFIFGVLAGKYVFEKKELPGYAWIVLIFSTILCFTVLKLNLLEGFFKRQIGILAGIPMTFLLAKLASWQNKYVRKVLQFFGNISLELYLCHIIFCAVYQNGNFFFSYQPGNTMKWILVLIFSTIVAYSASVILKYIPKVFQGDLCSLQK